MATAKQEQRQGTPAQPARPTPKNNEPADDFSRVPVAAMRVLVAEDSPVTQDLLKLILEQRGHTVDLAPDGERALAALNSRTYDIVLMDFHLPKIDGLEVATRYRQNLSAGPRPRFVAITADIKGLLSHTANCENFDEVIPKPFDLNDVLRVVEHPRDEEETFPTAKPAPLSTDKVASDTWQAQEHELLRWPEDFNAERLSARGIQASLADGRFDAIILNEPATVRDLSVIWTTRALHLLPVIDMTGSLSHQVDIDGSKRNVAETGALDRIIKSFHERRALLHTDLVYTDDIGEKLVGRMFVSEGGLKLRYDASTREHVTYDVILDFRSIEKELKDLLARGFVDRTFFDRFHICDRCGSSHFNIREECTDCGSAHLEEEAYLHHFKCAYQGPESDFRQGDDLVCPKCRRELSHFSVDYDKPGSMMRCQSCGHATSEPAVGFVCMECEAHYHGDTIRTRDVYSYALTERGRDFARAGRAMLDGGNTALRFAELPLELIVAVNGELKKFEADRTPFALLNISYLNAREVENTDGLRSLLQARDLFLENLHNTLRKNDRIVRGRNYDFALMTGASPAEIRATIGDLRSETTESLRVDLGVQIDVFGPEDFK